MSSIMLNRILAHVRCVLPRLLSASFLAVAEFYILSLMPDIPVLGSGLGRLYLSGLVMWTYYEELYGTLSLIICSSSVFGLYYWILS